MTQMYASIEALGEIKLPGKKATGPSTPLMSQQSLDIVREMRHLTPIVQSTTDSVIAHKKFAITLPEVCIRRINNNEQNLKTFIPLKKFHVYKSETRFFSQYILIYEEKIFG